MKANRVDFYDPLYDFVTFEEAARSRAREFLDAGFARSGAGTYGESISAFSDAKFILPFLWAFEFSRQNFLRQSNLAFLVYPSATHTRLAHSIGACYLGFLASQRVAVANAKPHESVIDSIYLSQFLQDSGWREEFYLALLLHDVGHFPFSHALETNKEFWDGFGSTLTHEDAACQLIQGRGDIFEASLRRKQGISPEIASEHPHLTEVFNTGQIDRDAVCYLISGETSFLTQKSPQRKAELAVIHELVSGLLDLDRVDHYRRDNLFTGLRAGTSVNFASLLGGLTVCYSPSVESEKPHVRLSPEAIGHAISLLQTKERLIQDCFEHPQNLAYEAMLHCAFNLCVFDDQFYEQKSSRTKTPSIERIGDMLVSTDDELLTRISMEGPQKARDNVFRIRYRQPFTPVTKISLPVGYVQSLSQVRDAITRDAGVANSRVVLRGSKGFGRGGLGVRSGEWLDLQRLRNSRGRQLVETEKYARQIEHFKATQDHLHDFVWVFTDEEELATKIFGVMQQVSDNLGGKMEEL